MIFKYLVFIVSLLISSSVFSAECQRYENTHPGYPLDGAHLQSGKCSTCASCHINGIFVGTQKSCLTCHNGDPSRLTIGRSSVHIPTGNLECSNCHGTTTFNLLNVSSISMHAVVGTTALIATSLTSCNMCHTSTGFYSSQGAGAMHSASGGEGCIQCHVTGASPRANTTRALTHHSRTTTATDCSYSGCHRPLGNTGKPYTQWDN